MNIKILSKSFKLILKPFMSEPKIEKKSKIFCFIKFKEKFEDFLLCELIPKCYADTSLYTIAGWFN